MRSMLFVLLAAFMIAAAGCAEVSERPEKATVKAVTEEVKESKPVTMAAPAELTLDATRDARVMGHSTEANFNGGAAGRLRTVGIQRIAPELVLVDFDRAAIRDFLAKNAGKKITAELVLTVYQVQSGPATVEIAVLDSGSDWAEGKQVQAKAAKGEVTFNEAQSGVKPWTTSDGKKVRNLKELLYADGDIRTLVNSKSVEAADSMKGKPVTIALDEKFVGHLAADANCRGLVVFNRHDAAKVDFYSRDQRGRGPKLVLKAG